MEVTRVKRRKKEHDEKHVKCWQSQFGDLCGRQQHFVDKHLEMTGRSVNPCRPVSNLDTQVTSYPFHALCLFFGDTYENGGIRLVLCTHRGHNQR